VSGYQVAFLNFIFMPIRLTNDYNIWVDTGLPCSLDPIDYKNKDNVKALQRIANIYSSIFYDSEIYHLDDYGSIAVDGIYGPKTSSRLKGIYGNQRLTKCNIMASFRDMGWPSTYIYNPDFDGIQKQLFAVTPKPVPTNPTNPTNPTDPQYPTEKKNNTGILLFVGLLLVAKNQKWI
jgi:hypothetical protein